MYRDSKMLRRIRGPGKWRRMRIKCGAELREGFLQTTGGQESTLP
jgi:hypothetical protein